MLTIHGLFGSGCGFVSVLSLEIGSEVMLSTWMKQICDGQRILKRGCVSDT